MFAMVTSMYAQCLKKTWKTLLLLGFFKIDDDHQMKESDCVVWVYYFAKCNVVVF